MKFVRLAICAAVAVWVVGCGQNAAPTDTPTIRAAIVADYPAVDGSTSAHPLQMVIACDLLDVPCDWSEMTIDNVQQSIIPAAEADQQKAQAIRDIAHNGTHGAYVNLIEGKTDVILVARAPSEDELQAADAAGVALDVRPVALDALVFLANAQNPVESLTLEAIRDIYTGKTTTWTELGVSIDPTRSGDEPLHAYQRDRNSGSQELIEALLMGDRVMIDAPDMITTSMIGPLNAIGGDPWGGGGDVLGLGYSVYYYVNFMFPHEYVKLIGVDGVQPTSGNIASGAYPLVAEVYIGVREDMPENSTTILFRDWLLSEDGQKAVAKSGYVPIK